MSVACSFNCTSSNNYGRAATTRTVLPIVVRKICYWNYVSSPQLPTSWFIPAHWTNGIPGPNDVAVINAKCATRLSLLLFF